MAKNGLEAMRWPSDDFKSIGQYLSDFNTFCSCLSLLYGSSFELGCLVIQFRR